MEERTNLEQMLSTAQMILAVLEQQAAGYTNLTIPAHLKVELEKKRQEVASLEARLSQLQGHQPANLPDNLPRYNDVFVGRKLEIERCLEALSPEERGWGVTIDGIGGMGKTALALEVAHFARKQAMFDAYLFASAKTTWLTAEGVREETLSLSSLDSSCREFARVLGQAEIVKMTDAKERRRALLDALRGRRTLLVWDNLETLNQEERDMIAEFVRKLPNPNKAIITSRRRTGESALTIRLDRLSEAEALAIAEKIRFTEHQVTCCGNLGLLYLERNLFTEAYPWYERQFALAQEVGRQELVAQAKSGLAQVLEEEGRYTKALPLAQAALEIRERLRDRDLDFSRQLVERLQRKAGMK
jgi:tetratricopeptide (TPR) repeat protein